MLSHTQVLPHSSSALELSPEPAVGSVRDANQAEAGSAASKAAVVRSFAADTVRETIEMADKARQAGRNHVELRVQTSDTEDVRIHLRWNQGTLHAKFVTGSNDLNQALAREWEHLVPRWADKGMKFSEPSFERNDQHSGQPAEQNATSGGQHRQHSHGNSNDFDFESTLGQSARSAVSRRPAGAVARPVDNAPLPAANNSGDLNLRAWA